MLWAWLFWVLGHWLASQRSVSKWSFYCFACQWYQKKYLRVPGQMFWPFKPTKQNRHLEIQHNESTQLTQSGTHDDRWPHSGPIDVWSLQIPLFHHNEFLHSKVSNKKSLLVAGPNHQSEKKTFENPLNHFEPRVEETPFLLEGCTDPSASAGLNLQAADFFERFGWIFWHFKFVWRKQRINNRILGLVWEPWQKQKTNPKNLKGFNRSS